jgi:hypothetical protein
MTGLQDFEWVDAASSEALAQAGVCLQGVVAQASGLPVLNRVRAPLVQSTASGFRVAEEVRRVRYEACNNVAIEACTAGGPN